MAKRKVQLFKGDNAESCEHGHADTSIHQNVLVAKDDLVPSYEEGKFEFRDGTKR